MLSVSSSTAPASTGTTVAGSIPSRSLDFTVPEWPELVPQPVDRIKAEQAASTTTSSESTTTSSTTSTTEEEESTTTTGQQTTSTTQAMTEAASQGQTRAPAMLAQNCVVSIAPRMKLNRLSTAMAWVMPPCPTAAAIRLARSRGVSPAAKRRFRSAIRPSTKAKTSCRAAKWRCASSLPSSRPSAGVSAEAWLQRSKIVSSPRGTSKLAAMNFITKSRNTGMNSAVSPAAIAGRTASSASPASACSSPKRASIASRETAFAQTARSVLCIAVSFTSMPCVPNTSATGVPAEVKRVRSPSTTLTPA